MAVPEGYTALARLGYADKGNYAAGTTYMTGDVVYHNGSSYVARKDNLKGVTPTNGNDWKYLARGFAAETMTDVQATDTNGVLGTAGAQVVSQALIDAIADRVMTKLVERSSIVQTESTDPSTVPSSPYFKQVTDKLTSDFGDLATDLSNVHTALDPLKSYYVNNMDNSIVSKVNIVLWDVNTASTPFKTGNTNRGNGFCITYNSGEPYLCQLAMAVGDSNLFTRHRGPEGWSGWTTK